MTCYPECRLPILLLLACIGSVPGRDTSSLIPCWLTAVGLIMMSTGPLRMVVENLGARPGGPELLAGPHSSPMKLVREL